MQTATAAALFAPSRNLVLAALSPETVQGIRLHLEPVRLSPGQVLYEADTKIDYVHFLESGWASLVTVFEDGFQTEVGLVGREGMVGISLIHGLDTDTTEAVARVAADALRMSASAFRQAMAHSSEFRARLLRVSDADRAQAKQIAACNSHHKLEQRLARSLLAVMDRSESPSIALSQETLAAMLCVHRPSLTVAAGRLQRAGLIRHTAGQVEILDRRGLEHVSCECYAALRRRTASSIVP